MFAIKILCNFEYTYMQHVIHVTININKSKKGFTERSVNRNGLVSKSHSNVLTFYRTITLL